MGRTKIIPWDKLCQEALSYLQQWPDGSYAQEIEIHLAVDSYIAGEVLRRLRKNQLASSSQRWVSAPAVWKAR